MNNEIVVVDNKDNQIWTWEKMDVHKKGLLHRAISVLIVNKKWEMLLQQRALNKYHCWWIWSNATCTHPYPNESNIDAAHRRLKEEMWFDADLKEIFEFQYTAHFDNWLTENEYDHVFLWEYEWEIIPNPNEVNDYKWISIDELKTDIKHNSELYSEWFKIILDKAISVKYL
jgi:isopentenyl-diphosphate delta-isomerase